MEPHSINSPEHVYFSYALVLHNHTCSKGKKFGFYGNDADLFEPLCRAADDKLFNKILKNPNHVLHRFLPETKTMQYSLRPRRHGFILPTKDDRNFFNRMLFKDMF